MASWSQIEGSPQPPGCTWSESGQSFNFALFSRHATSVTLLLFTEGDLINPCLRIALDHLIHKSGRIWHCRVSVHEIGDARYYGYSIDGPNNPAAGFNAFDRDKVLLDPYARLIYFPPDFKRSASMGRGSNAGRAPLGMVARIPKLASLGFEPNPRHTSDTIIYEMHVRGFTRRENSGVPAEKTRNFRQRNRKDSLLEGPWNHRRRIDAGFSI
jgi:glycogen operon protein